MRQCPYLVTGLRLAGFTGGWLEYRAHASSIREVIHACEFGV
jgi:hypothetical protein